MQLRSSNFSFTRPSASDLPLPLDLSWCGGGNILFSVLLNLSYASHALSSQCPAPSTRRCRGPLSRVPRSHSHSSSFSSALSPSQHTFRTQPQLPTPTSSSIPPSVPTSSNQAGYYALLASYNYSYVPYNSSYPTLRIGLSLSLGYDDMLTGLDTPLQFIVDLINFRGGIVVGGAGPHYLVVTYALDGGSEELTSLIYRDMEYSQQYTAYLAPHGDELLESLQSWLVSSQSLIVSVANMDPANYQTANTSLFSAVDTAVARWKSTLTAINAQAQSYAAATGEGSVNGISSLCLFTINDTLVEAARLGVLQWIEAEDARRQYADNITVYVDHTWQLDSDYVTALSACPDRVDVLLMQDGSITGSALSDALRVSQLKPKAALGIDPLSAILYHTSSAVSAAGWLLPYPVTGAQLSTLPALGGRLLSLQDSIHGLYTWAAGAGYNATHAAHVAYAYFSALDIMAAALAQSNSTQPADLRAAMSSLNGQRSVLGEVQFDPLTKVNTALNTMLFQVGVDGTLVEITNDTAAERSATSGMMAIAQTITYPFPSAEH